MNKDNHQQLITLLNDNIKPFSSSVDYSSLLDKIGDARFVMLGEATHGTHEFYKARIEITKQLIEQKGFMAVAIEGDWTDAYRVHCYLQGKGSPKDAETYYRSMFNGHISSWNIRDMHMSETVNVLIDHLEHRFKQPAKIIIWAHNSHVGDARATEMGEQGEVNIGQLLREQYIDTYSIGFSTHEGFVTAASNWDEPAECKKITPGFAESYEELFHQLAYKNFILHLIGNETLEHVLKIPRLQRAIGVIYRPETERLSHYFFTRLPYQFDSLIHFDKTTALQAL